MTATARPISSIDPWLMTQERGTCARWPEREGWWRCKGSGQAIYPVRGPEAYGGLWCACPGWHRYGYCAHSAAVRSHYGDCYYCGGPVTSDLERQAKGWLLIWRCLRAGCSFRKVL